MLRHRLESEWASSTAHLQCRCPCVSSWLGPPQNKQHRLAGWGWGSASMPRWCELDVVSHILMSLCTSGTWWGHCELCDAVYAHKGRDGDFAELVCRQLSPCSGAADAHRGRKKLRVNLEHLDKLLRETMLIYAIVLYMEKKRKKGAYIPNLVIVITFPFPLFC